MKRLHLHVSVPDLHKSIEFYTSLFGAEPTVSEKDYAKWLLDDPAVNFAISIGRGKNGLNHLGFQLDSDDALKVIKERLDKTGIQGTTENDANCCYANSNKYWTIDPAGIPWEQFHTLGEIKTFGEAPSANLKTAACGCMPTNFASNNPGGCCS